ncbi:hypothetical protein [Streptomyces sp. TLI_146]|uniref:hypothetical protein n=1 Tax=Streptomyces sp. TLI_146 TaxID=1938858 RepID=UPI000C708BA7|nr:hypothetical protein [Streptomyces sp. TLI_146]PKV90047.1 hypothetical protein BX283_7708 [Streptomyces sp. TLI_146]
MPHPTQSSPTLARASDTSRNSLLHVSLAVEAERAERTHTLLGEAAGSLLTAMTVPTSLVQQLAEMATAAARYLVEHSEQPRYRLWIQADPGGITLAVTDCIEHPGAERPAWLPATCVSHQGSALMPDPSPQSYGADQALDVQRTREGHFRVACRMPWAEPTSPQSPC